MESIIGLDGSLKFLREYINGKYCTVDSSEEDYISINEVVGMVNYEDSVAKSTFNELPVTLLSAIAKM